MSNFSHPAAGTHRPEMLVEMPICWFELHVAPRWAAIWTGSSRNGAAASHARAACAGTRLLVKLIT